MVELFWPGNPMGHLTDPVTGKFWMGNNWQHFIMYSFYGLFGIISTTINKYGIKCLAGNFFSIDEL